MAITTYSELLSSVADWAARSDLTSVIPDCVALFEAKANRVLQVRQMVTSSTITIAAGVGTLPTDYLEWKRVTWVGSSSRNLEYVHPAYFAAQYPNPPSGVPAVFTIEGTSIKDMPTDSTSLVMSYAQKIPALSVSSTTNWLLTANPDVYLAGAMCEVGAYMKDGASAQAWNNKSEAALMEMIRLSALSTGQAIQRSTQVTP